MDNLKLYIMNSCPFSQKVMGYINDNGLDIEFRDISQNPQYEEELIKFGGKKQVPMLLIGDKPLYESDDIILYLKENVTR